MICETKTGRWRQHSYDQPPPEGRCIRCGTPRRLARSIGQAEHNARRRSIRSEMNGMRHLHDESGEVSGPEGLWIAVVLMAAADAKINPSGRFKMTVQFAQTAQDFWTSGAYRDVLNALALDTDKCDRLLLAKFPWLERLIRKAETAA